MITPEQVFQILAAAAIAWVLLTLFDRYRGDTPK